MLVRMIFLDGLELFLSNKLKKNQLGLDKRTIQSTEAGGHAPLLIFFLFNLFLYYELKEIESDKN